MTLRGRDYYENTATGVTAWTEEEAEAVREGEGGEEGEEKQKVALTGAKKLAQMRKDREAATEAGSFVPSGAMAMPGMGGGMGGLNLMKEMSMSSKFGKQSGGKAGESVEEKMARRKKEDAEARMQEAGGAEVHDELQAKLARRRQKSSEGKGAAEHEAGRKAATEVGQEKEDEHTQQPGATKTMTQHEAMTQQRFVPPGAMAMPGMGGGMGGVGGQQDELAKKLARQAKQSGGKAGESVEEKMARRKKEDAEAKERGVLEADNKAKGQQAKDAARAKREAEDEQVKEMLAKQRAKAQEQGSSNGGDDVSVRPSTASVMSSGFGPDAKDLHSPRNGSPQQQSANTTSAGDGTGDDDGHEPGALMLPTGATVGAALATGRESGTSKDKKRATGGHGHKKHGHKHQHKMSKATAVLVLQCFSRCTLATYKVKLVGDEAYRTFVQSLEESGLQLIQHAKAKDPHSEMLTVQHSGHKTRNEVFLTWGGRLAVGGRIGGTRINMETIKGVSIS
jgi:hypothetical protein